MATHDYIGNLWSGILERNPALPILRNDAGLVVLSAQHTHDSVAQPRTAFRRLIEQVVVTRSIIEPEIARGFV